ncbi:alpha/beta hydrolase, partial [Streptomyces anulatus]
MQNQPTFILVHGAFANSFSFAPLQAELALLGHPTVAGDPPGPRLGGAVPAADQTPPETPPHPGGPGGRHR